MEIPVSTGMEYEVLNSINYIRSTKGLPNLLPSKELEAMALSHNQDMASRLFLGTHSPTFGSVEKRARVHNVPTTGENIGFVVYPSENVSTVVEDWLKDDIARANLLHPSAKYIGIDTYNQPSSNKVYVTAEVLNSSSYFTLPQSGITTVSEVVNASGKTLKDAETVTAYLLSSDFGYYIDKQTFPATVENGEFSAEVKLWKAGNYILQVDNATCKITYKY